MGYFRSTLYLMFMWLTIPVATTIFLIVYPIPYKYRSRLISSWSRVTLSVLSFICGLKFEISGHENIPEKPCIIFCKHQSTWETMALQLLFTPQVWILKRELLWIPFFGWTLASMKSIAIDRSSSKKALKQVVEQGTQRLNEGNWVVIFPEGTRTRPGDKPNYKVGGAMLANQSKFDVLPIAHNAGEFWPKGQYVKKAGTIKMVIGPVIKSSELSTKEISRNAEQWIETTLNEIYEKTY
ncbi:MAG: 1-acyl-sn-glycerol-3-phosphate acyltransferase [gamma proteobacterium symbiont of Bathyaustriella thionipta]|nr:1-acyl-sn-glycerol-3-phosphate acyltransferase [gamma proteobacterium symbiont of Bathyaustriella thionipta]MCU7950128.1 1-acyl-sn-glycerol-3-phosphate acyltransferase [gamma proteobacterium symbiont of Bathyaustriella thionipta]MCU7954860.1 1-acyl-sn-glycerol-3-phosphate acyltransferase [gamma proteobacterium symbiont of Bathyaustriella thionipta]MCU7956689.1 1-acyl-sn-glycerol-3-phosphate acyltransferase [gamma proteobacterium symbiont of Bathyaustriella thionipta]MCU7968084.1 1-acyl-sn-gl